MVWFCLRLLGGSCGEICGDFCVEMFWVLWGGGLNLQSVYKSTTYKYL